MQTTMQAISKQSGKIKEMFSSVSQRYDLANSVLSLGIHHIWRRRLLKALELNSTDCALDLCTGTGDLLPPLRKRFNKVVGVDFCRPMLELAKQKVNGLSGIELVEGDALALPFSDNSFDLVSVAFGVRNFEDLERGLQETKRVCKPSGQILILEFGSPTLPVWREIYSFYSRVLLPQIGGLITGNTSAYSYLNRSALDFPCAEAFVRKLEGIGLQRIRYSTLSAGIAYLYSATKV